MLKVTQRVMELLAASRAVPTAEKVEAAILGERRQFSLDETYGPHELADLETGGGTAVSVAERIHREAEFHRLELCSLIDGLYQVQQEIKDITQEVRSGSQPHD